MTPIEHLDRARLHRRLATENFDVLVIGGGITGAGVALDAASRGLRTALVEARDIASGTSSRSSKLVHGGLRYLRQGDLRLVHEALAERRLLLRNAPHLVDVIGFLIPLFGRGGAVDRAVVRAYSAALWMYDLAGGWRSGRRHRRVGRDEAIAWMPALDANRLVAGFVYDDARADDARLTLAILRTAISDFDAVALNHLPVVALLRDPRGAIRGARLADGTEVRARVVINATGVWADALRQLDEGVSAPSLRPAKGIHLTLLRERLPCRGAAVLPVPSDGRSLFVVPWDDRVYVGTTDTDYDGPLDDPLVTAEDVAYVLDGLNAWLRDPIRREDVVGLWAGLRPLVRGAATARTADLSRRHTVHCSAAGLITVTGGKLTTYRRMARDAVDAACTVLGISRRCRTARLVLFGGRKSADEVLATLVRVGLDPTTATHLWRRFGSEAVDVASLAVDRADLAAPLVPGLPYLRAEAIWAVRTELANDLDDILARRTRALLLDDLATATAASDVARLVAPELGWDAATAEAAAARLRADVERHRLASGLAAEGVPGRRGR